MSKLWTREQLETSLGAPLDELQAPDVLERLAFPRAHHLHWLCGCHASAFASNLDTFTLRACDPHEHLQPRR